MSAANNKTLRRLVRHFRVLRGWTVRMVNDPDNHGASWGGRMSNRFSIGTWDRKAGPQPPDYILHEVLHAAVISVVKMDKRKPKQQRQAEELLVQDLCTLITPTAPAHPRAVASRGEAGERQINRRWTMPAGTMSDALRELEGATQEHKEAQRITGEARSRETAAVNRLNAAQKRVDELVAGMKKGAPRNSDWGRVRRNAVPVAQ